MSDPNETEFTDPLESYDPPTYDNPLEEALATQPVSAIKTTPFASIAPETTVRDALAKMTGDDIACLLVAENGRLVGVFSDRDVLDRCALELEDVGGRSVVDVMTVDPVYVHDTDSAMAALSVMAVSGHRHVPVVDLDGQLTGIVSPRRVTEFLTTHFTVE